MTFIQAGSLFTAGARIRSGPDSNIWRMKYRADGATVSAGVVSAWSDTSGNNRNLSPVVGSTGAAYQASHWALGNRPAVYFNHAGINGMEDTTGGVAFDNPFTIYLVGYISAPIGPSYPHTFIGWGSVSTVMGFASGTEGLKLNGLSNAYAIPGVSIYRPSIYCMIWDGVHTAGGQVWCYQNSLTPVVTAMTTGINTPGTFWQMGTGYGTAANYGLGGWISECNVRNSHDSDTEIAAEMTRLSTYYSIPLV